MNVAIALLFVLIAGVINGSFALPTKYISKWRFENIWLQFAVWAFVILPWLIIFILVPHVFQVYAEAPLIFLLVIFLGGLLFGFGQICFALAMNYIGLGLGFVINIGLGIGLGFLMPLVIQHPDKIFTPFGAFTLVGVLLAVVGLIISNKAGILRDQDRNAAESKAGEGQPVRSNAHKIGVILAVLAGVSSASQNFVFSFTSKLQEMAVSAGAGQLGAANIIWPGFLLCGFIPYAGYTLYLLAKNKSFGNYRQAGIGKYYLFGLIMGLFWYGSLLFYSQASRLIGSLGPLVGWPLFMVLIILVSSFWGWQHKEWDGCGTRAKSMMKRGLLFLILSIIVLGYSSIFHT